MLSIQLSDRPIVVIEDSDEDFEVTVWALRQAKVTNPVHRCANAGAVAALWADRPDRPTELMAAYPVLVMMDLNIPGTKWHETLENLRNHPWWKLVPIVVVSTTQQSSTVAACYSAGVGGYLKKPVDLGKFGTMIENTAKFWLQTVLPTPPFDPAIP